MMGENVKAPACGGVMYLGVPHYCDHPYLPKSMRKESCACRPSPATALPDELEARLKPNAVVDHVPGLAVSNLRRVGSDDLAERLSHWIVQNNALKAEAHSTIAALRAQLQHLGELAGAHRDELEAEVKRLTEQKEALMAEVARCHARLEIDHVFVAEGDDFVRREVPMGERLSIPDAVECRDATISILEADARKAMESKE